MTRQQIGLGLVVGLLAAGWGLAGHAAPPGPRLALAASKRAVAAPVLTVVAPTGDRLAVAPPRADHRLTAPPSVSAAQIDAILAGYGSPAVGQGATLYDLGVQVGIDPAYALAFWVVESRAGTRGVARSTRSLGNIRCTRDWPRCVDGYRAYDSYAAGMTDWYNLIRTLYIEQWGLRTPATILPRYAPWGDSNDPAVYAATVKALVAGWQP